jgi:hypothetical protein
VSTVSFGILQSSKSQARNPKEATNTKLQNDRPLMLDKGSAVAGRPSCPGRLWDLKLGACLELVWSLELYRPTHSKSVASQSGDSEDSVTALQDASRCSGPRESPPGLGLRQPSGALTARVKWTTGETWRQPHHTRGKNGRGLLQPKTWRQIRRFREELEPPRLDALGAMKPFNRFTHLLAVDCWK